MARIAFAGTPEFATTCLNALLAADYRPVAVLTQPDRPAGRGKKLTPSAVKVCAQAAGLPVYQPVTLKAAEPQQWLRDWDLDGLIVVAYGMLLPPTVLALPKRGCLNVHASLLPRWRGAAPIQRAILAGDRETGVCLMEMAAGLDTGPVWAKATCPIDDTMTAATLHDQLAALGAKLLVEQLEAWLRGTGEAIPQAEQGVTYAKKLQKSEAALSWTKTAPELARQVRAFNPYPMATCRVQKAVVRVWAAEALPEMHHATPGQVLRHHAAGLEVACGEGVLRLLTMQWPGKKPLPMRDIVNAYSLQGELLE